MNIEFKPDIGKFLVTVELKEPYWCVQSGSPNATASFYLSADEVDHLGFLAGSALQDQELTERDRARPSC